MTIMMLLLLLLIDGDGDDDDNDDGDANANGERCSDEFWFTSRRCEGYPFSLTIFMNKQVIFIMMMILCFILHNRRNVTNVMCHQCHIRLSACCESKRTVGARLGQVNITIVFSDPEQKISQI